MRHYYKLKHCEVRAWLLFEGVLTLKTNIYRTMHIEVDDKSSVIIYNGKDSEERIHSYIDTYI